MDDEEVGSTPMVLFTINKTHGKHVPLSIPEAGTVKFQKSSMRSAKERSRESLGTGLQF